MTIPGNISKQTKSAPFHILPNSSFTFSFIPGDETQGVEKKINVT
jgi:hypothetical protein